jgi:DeoR/GlpR family transcriptional regulator of sugar metabolism
VFNGVYEGLSDMLSAESILSIVLSRSIGWSAFVVTAICTAGASYLLADSSKYGNVHLMALSRLADYSCVITDDDFPLDLRDELEAACNEVIYAS